MTQHTTLATAVDKSRLSSNTAYLILMEIDVVDSSSGNVNTTLRFAANNEAFVYRGLTYNPMPFEVDITNDRDSAPQTTLTVYDYGQIIQAALQNYGNSMAWPARFLVVNATNPGPNPEMEQEFRLLDATAASDNYTVAFTVGAENPLSLRFPARDQFRDRCPWVYKGVRCKYAGSLTSCDRTKNGANGCSAHNNVINFGGFPGVEHSVS